MHRAATPRPTAQSTHELSPLRSWEPNASQRPMPAAISGKVPGSGMAGAVAGTTAPSVEKFVTVVVPSRFTSTVKANPSIVSVVRAGIVPAASENILKANVLPEVDVPSGELNAGP